MPSGVVRIKARQPAVRADRPAVGEVAVRFPALGRAFLVGALSLPHGRLRRSAVEWMIRVLAAGGINRQDFDLMRAFASPRFEFQFAPELLAAMGREVGPVRGIEAGIDFLTEWYDVWGGFTVVPQEVIDFGDGRVLTLTRLFVQGGRSGVRLDGQEEAQLWMLGGNEGILGGQQWWSWREALEAVGL